MQQMPVTVHTMYEACVCLHNFICLRNPAIQNIQVDAEDAAAHNLVPGAWRQDANFLDLDVPQGGNRHSFSHETKGLFKSLFQQPSWTCAVVLKDD